LAPLNAVENERMLRLLNVVTRFHLHDQSNEPLPLSITPQQIDRWRASVLYPNAELRDLLGYGLGIEQDVDHFHLSFETLQASRRATELVMRLQAIDCGKDASPII
ncbi:MAG: hypothetical protein KDA52_05720, partial [Planctomycetaceae bacterium]|nr:hypothetical protein [Planctomycetaceae bacterium]